jgi:DNA-binding transcriptional LysR family regulator
LINTCMAWTIEPAVAQFIDRYGQLGSIIVLTTSDGGDVLPDLENRRIDAMSSASTLADADPLANEIIERIKKHL